MDTLGFWEGSSCTSMLVGGEVRESVFQWEAWQRRGVEAGFPTEQLSNWGELS